MSDILIGIPETENLNAYIDFSGPYVYFTIEEKSARVELKPDRTIDRMRGTKSKGEDITTNANIMSSAKIPEDESEEAMAVAMAKQVSSKGNLNDIVDNLELIKRVQTVAKKLPYL